MATSREILPATASRPEIEVVRSTRRTRTVQLAPHKGGRLRLMVPATSTDREIEDYLRRMLPKVEARRARQDADTQRGALDEFLRERADCEPPTCQKPQNHSQSGGSPTRSSAGPQRPLLSARFASRIHFRAHRSTPWIQ